MRLELVGCMVEADTSDWSQPAVERKRQSIITEAQIDSIIYSLRPSYTVLQNCFLSRDDHDRLLDWSAKTGCVVHFRTCLVTEAGHRPEDVLKVS